MGSILVVGASRPGVSHLYSRLIEQGYHTLEMSNVEEALETLHCVRADLVLVDAKKLHTDARRLIDALREDPIYRDLPIVVFGANLHECRALRPTVRPGAVLMRDEPLEDVLRNVHSYVAPLSEPFN